VLQLFRKLSLGAAGSADGEKSDRKQNSTRTIHDSTPEREP